MANICPTCLKEIPRSGGWACIVPGNFYPTVARALEDPETIIYCCWECMDIDPGAVGLGCFPIEPGDL